MTKIISTDKARQGPGGRPVLYVLITALVLAAIVWAGVELYGEQISAPEAGVSSGAGGAAPAPAQ